MEDLMKIDKIIKKAEKYLDYEDNWDDEGSKGYKEETLNRVKILLQDGYGFLNKNTKFNIPEPDVSPGPDGSFDLLWDSKYYSLLANIPEDKDKPISYFGYRHDSHKIDISGEFIKTFCEGLFIWLYLRGEE